MGPLDREAAPDRRSPCLPRTGPPVLARALMIPAPPLTTRFRAASCILCLCPRARHRHGGPPQKMTFIACLHTWTPSLHLPIALPLVATHCSHLHTPLIHLIVIRISPPLDTASRPHVRRPLVPPREKRCSHSHFSLSAVPAAAPSACPLSSSYRARYAWMYHFVVRTACRMPPGPEYLSNPPTAHVHI